MKRSTLKKTIVSFLAAAVLTALGAGGLLFSADSALGDAMYQGPSALEGNVLIIGIDAESIEALGPYPWSRDVMAGLLETLNADPAKRPAVIGLDVLYVGEGDPEADAALVAAAGRADNVVLASAANFGAELITEEGGNFYMDNYYVTSYDEPFPALKAVTEQGHVNAMYDVDGILRHSILYVDLPEGEQIPSFNLKIYEKYCEYHGLEAGRLPATDSRHRWYLPYSALPGDYYDGFSVSGVLSGAIPTDLFAGAIVLIGPYATGLQDNVTTAIDPAEPMYGVEYQANCLDALIDQNFKQEAPAGLQLLLLFGLAMVAGLWFWERKMLPATLLWLGVGGGWLGLCLLCYKLGWVLHPLYVPLAVTVIYVAAVAVNYVRAALEKRRVTNTFKRYVAPEIVTEILREGTDSLGLGGKLTDVAVLFVDIRGFTTMSELLEPPRVVEILNKYLTLTSSCIVKNGGTLDKFVGDATMAIWGAPLPQEDYVFKAVKTALDMVEGSAALGEELEREFGRSVSFGVGVHCGPAVVGNIGAEMRMDFTAIGDTVNTAARLEANAPGGKILISKAVAEALKGRILTTSLGDSIKLKGKSEGFEIFTVDGLA